MPPAKIPSKVRLHDLPISHYCVKARALLGYKGVKFERVDAPYHDRQDLLKISGQDYVPYIEWGKTGVAWYDIPDFLEREVPAPTLYPGGERAAAKMIENWAHQVVEEAAWKVALPKAPETFKDARERWVFEEMQIRRRGPLEAHALRMKDWQADLDGVLDLVEGPLDTRAWMLPGDAPSLADFALYGALTPLFATGIGLPKERKRLRDWQSRVEKAGKL